MVKFQSGTKDFFINFWRVSFFFVGPLIPCFRLLVTSTLGFKARVDHLTYMF